MEEEEDETEVSHKRLPRGSSCLICKRGKRRCDGKRPTCGRCERVGCTCVYGQVGSRRTVTGRGTDRPPPARKAAASPRPDPSVSQALVLAPSDWTVGTSPPREPPPVASLVRPPSDWVVGGALPMAQITGSIIEAIVRMRSEDMLDIPKTKAFLKRIGPTINRAVGNDVIRYFRGLLETETRGDASADATALAVGPSTHKRKKTAAGLAHVLLSWEDQGSIWLRFSSGVTGSLEVTVSEAMAKLFITTEELAVMIKESQLAPCYSWTKFIEPDSVGTAADALYRTILERDSNNTRYCMIQCQTRQGLSVRCHANFAWYWGSDQVASALVVRLKPMIRLSRLSPDYHYITPSTLVAAAEPDSPLSDPSHVRSSGSLEPGMDMGRRQEDVPMLSSPPVALAPPWVSTCPPLPNREPTWRAEEERGAWLGSAQQPSTLVPHAAPPSGWRHLMGRRAEVNGDGFDLTRWTGDLSCSPRSAGPARTADLSKVLEHAATAGTRYVLSRDDEDMDARGRETVGGGVRTRDVDAPTGGLTWGDAYEEAETDVRTWGAPDERVYRVAGFDAVYSAPHADNSGRNALGWLDDLSDDEWASEAVPAGSAGRSVCGPIRSQSAVPRVK